ncbi:cytochrome P450 716B1-like protein [Tanacetum coccineum]
MIKSLLVFPVNLPFTTFNRGINARKKLEALLLDLLNEKREALKEQKQRPNPHKDEEDLITSLLKIHDDDSSTMMSDEEISDTVIVVMIAGYDTTSVLLMFLVRLLANNESIYSSIAQEFGTTVKALRKDREVRSQLLNILKKL